MVGEWPGPDVRLTAHINPENVESIFEHFTHSIDGTTVKLSV